MEWIVIGILILVSVILLLLEFLVFPGTTVAGVLGLTGVGVAVYMAYATMGTMAGNVTLLCVAVVGGIATVYALRARTWRRFQLKSQIDSTVERVDEVAQVGEEGVCVGRMAPGGRVEIGDRVVEGESLSGFLDEGSRVVVTRVVRNKVYVKLKSE